MLNLHSMVALVLKLKNSLGIDHYGTELEVIKTWREPNHHHAKLCCCLGLGMPQNVRDDAENEEVYLKRDTVKHIQSVM